MPIIADIHFQYRLALAAIEAGVDALRLNPGNIRKPDQIKVVAREAKDRGLPIRIGVNAGSLDPDIAERTAARRPRRWSPRPSASSPTSPRSASTT